MNEIFYKCTLLSDIVLNSSLATEGNLTSLDYIPGSNFLGIVASELYNNDLDRSMAFKLFHSNIVRFGDATIYEDALSYTIPFSLFHGKNDSTENVNYFLHHHVVETLPTNNDGDRIQLKQERLGYLYHDGSIRRDIKKSFAIKSAQDRETRASKDGQMFGFESITKGQIFAFSIQFEDESLIEIVSKVLIGNKRIGKSKSAEYGQVNIEVLGQPKEIGSFISPNYTLVYAQSNLSFMDHFGQPTFQPTAKDLGFDSGEIIWEKSQIRTFSYSPWNYKRNTSNTQRHCIAKGSVFFVNVPSSLNKNNIGYFQGEGLGRVVYNPLFLNSGDHGKTALLFRTKKEGSYQPNEVKVQSKLGKYLKAKVGQAERDQEIADKIHELIYNENFKIGQLKKISSSQWGGIRAIASRAKNMESLGQQLFAPQVGYLTHGVSALKYWSSNKEMNLRTFKQIFDENIVLNTGFIERFATEMAKEKQRNSKN